LTITELISTRHSGRKHLH